MKIIGKNFEYNNELPDNEDFSSKNPEDLLKDYKRLLSEGKDIPEDLEKTLQDNGIFIKKIDLSSDSNPLSSLLNTGEIDLEKVLGGMSEDPMKNILGKMFSDVLKSVAGSDNDDDDDESHPKENENKKIEAIAKNELERLQKIKFGSIQVDDTNDVLEDFKSKVCEDDNISYDKIIGKLGLIVPDSMKDASEDVLSYISKFTVMGSSDRYIILKGTVRKSPTSDDVPVSCIYLGAVEINGNFALVIPSCGSFIQLDDEDNFVFYNKEENPEMFEEDGTFIFNAAIADSSLSLEVAKKKKSVITMKKVAKSVKKQYANVTSNSNILKIGKLEFNDTTDAKILKLDSGLDKEEKSEDIYIKFRKVLNKKDLETIKKYFYDSGSIHSSYIQNLELKAGSGLLYVELEDGSEILNALNY